MIDGAGRAGEEEYSLNVSETDPHGLRSVYHLDGGPGGAEAPAWEGLEGGAGLWVLLSLVAALASFGLVGAKVAGWEASWWWCVAPVVFFYGMIAGAIVSVRRAGLSGRRWT